MTKHLTFRIVFDIFNLTSCLYVCDDMGEIVIINKIFALISCILFILIILVTRDVEP